MNYTKPNDPDHQDKPQDWLFSAMVFTRALYRMLKEKEGVVVEVIKDMKDLTEYKKVIVYKQDNQIHVVECDEGLQDGQMVWMHDE